MIRDPFASIQLGDIKRGDVADLRDRLGLSLHPATVHKILSAVKAVLSEAYYREDIPTNPGALVGSIQCERAERGVFSVEELRSLFAANSPEPWDDELTYCVFNTAARTGDT